MTLQRIQKIIAQTGKYSRRQAEQLIKENLVTANGKPVKLGDQANAHSDAIKVNGKLIPKAAAPIYLAFHKPKSVLSIFKEDHHKRKTLLNFTTNIKLNLTSVGRLDYFSEGLVLLTNDGSFAQRLNRNKNVVRTYHVKVKGHPDEKQLNRLKTGARTENVIIKPSSVSLLKKLQNKSLIEINFSGMKAVKVKEYFELKRYLVERVVQYKIGHLSINNIPSGKYKSLRKSQIDPYFT